MMDLPNALMIGSTGRNSGKTQLACSLIRRFCGQHAVVGLKVTTVSHRSRHCPRGNGGCGACTSFAGDSSLSEETNRDSSKDTSRLLAAGARRVFWWRVHRDSLTAEWPGALAAIGRDTLIVCESNSLRHVVRPGIFVIAETTESSVVKGSAAAVLEQADRVIHSDGAQFDTPLDDFQLLDGRWGLLEDACAVIMAGGQSRRMGTDKGLLPVGGVPLAQRLWRQLRPNVRELLVSSNDTAAYAFLGEQVVPDREPDQGPMMGIASALAHSHWQKNLVVACDVASADLPLARRMLQRADDAECVVPRTPEGRLEPLFAVYRKSVLPALDRLLQAGVKKVDRLFEVCRTAYVPVAQGQLPNLNTPADYRAFLRTAAPQPSPEGHHDRA